MAGIKFKRRKYDHAPLIGGEQVTATAEQMNAAGAFADQMVGMTATGAEIDAAATPPTARAITATVGGLTTGLILASDRWVTITSGDAAHIVTLPAIADVALGQKIEGLNGGTACEMRTPASSGTTINGTNGDSLESVIAANAYFEAQKISATGWRLTTQVGATIASPVPD